MALQEMIKGFDDFLYENVDPENLHPAEIQLIVDELSKKWGIEMKLPPLFSSIQVTVWWVTSADDKTALARSNRVAGPFAKKEDAEKALLNLKRVKSPDFFKDIHNIDKKSWHFNEIPLRVESLVSYVDRENFIKIAQNWVNMKSLLSKKKGLIGGKKIGLI